MASKLRTYAEKILGVHEVYDEAKAAQAEIVGYHSSLLEAKDLRRHLTEDIADMEVEIWRGLRNTHPELSATALDGKARHARRTDPTLKDLRHRLLEAQSVEDKYEQDIKACQNRITIATARMIQLGGYIPMLVKIMEDEAVAPVNTP